MITIEEYEKSGQMAGSVGAVIGLIVGIGIAVLVLIFVGSLAGQTWELVQEDIEAMSTKVINETMTLSNVTPVSLGYNRVVEGSLVGINATGSEVGLANFTVDYFNGTILAVGDPIIQHGDVINWTYIEGNVTIEDHIKNGVISSFKALEKTGDYLPIIVMAFVISIVLFLVLGMTGGFTGGGGRGGAL